jgi:methyl-accepting chemotaxis protein
VGRTDVEDALKRLENLTHDESLMATAQVLKVTDNVDNKVTSIDDGVKDVIKEVTDIGDNVRAVINEAQDIGDGVRAVITEVQDIGEDVRAVIDGA